MAVKDALRSLCGLTHQVSDIATACVCLTQLCSLFGCEQSAPDACVRHFIFLAQWLLMIQKVAQLAVEWRSILFRGRQGSLQFLRRCRQTCLFGQRNLFGKSRTGATGEAEAYREQH